jgi:Histidinol phosphatase and related hydrolases of the PHP family
MTCFLLIFCIALSAAQTPSGYWYKGNTHTHTFYSDGDSLPDEVARWYVEHGYDFLVLTDHNVRISVDRLNDYRLKPVGWVATESRFAAEAA